MSIHLGRGVAVDKAMLLGTSLGLEVGFVLDIDLSDVLVIFVFYGYARGGRVGRGPAMVGSGLDTVCADNAGVCGVESHALADLGGQLRGRLFKVIGSLGREVAGGTGDGGSGALLVLAAASLAIVVIRKLGDQ